MRRVSFLPPPPPPPPPPLLSPYCIFIKNINLRDARLTSVLGKVAEP